MTSCPCLDAYDAGKHLQLLKLSLPPADNLVLELMMVILHLYQALLLGRVVLPLLLVLDGCLLLLLCKVQLIILHDANMVQMAAMTLGLDVACLVQPDAVPNTGH